VRVKDTQMLAGKFADKGLPNEDFHPGSGHTEEICIAVSPPPREAPFGAEKNWVTIEDFHPGCDVPKKFVTRILPRQNSLRRETELARNASPRLPCSSPSI
jgi:hypothetical protein